MSDVEKYITGKEAYNYMGGKSEKTSAISTFMKRRRLEGLEYSKSSKNQIRYKISWIDKFYKKQQ